MITKTQIFFWTCLILSVKLKSQTYSNDAAIWLGAEIEKSVAKKTKVYVAHRCRINNNYSSYSLGFIKAGISYEFKKWLVAETDYGLGKHLQDDGYYLLKHRFNFSVSFKQTYKKFTMSYRARVQSRLSDQEIAETEITQNSHIRNRIGLKYELTNRIKPYLRYELYSPLYQLVDIGFNRSRAETGVEYKLTRNSGLEVYYMIQSELYLTDKPTRDFILGVEYKYTFN